LLSSARCALFNCFFVGVFMRRILIAGLALICVGSVFSMRRAVGGEIKFMLDASKRREGLGLEKQRELELERERELRLDFERRDRILEAQMRKVSLVDESQIKSFLSIQSVRKNLCHSALSEVEKARFMEIVKKLSLDNADDVKKELNEAGFFDLFLAVNQGCLRFSLYFQEARGPMLVLNFCDDERN